MDNTLIKRAIQEYYTEHEWLLIMLKNSWTSEGNPRISYRDMLKLNEYATIEITKYQKDPILQCSIGVSTNHLKRPKWISVEIDPTAEYNIIRMLVHNLLDKVNYEILQIRNDYITVTAIDVSNQIE